MSNFNQFIDFSEFDELNLIVESKYTKLFTSHKLFQPSKKYLFKIFQFDDFPTKDQKIILETFYQISKMNCQYLQSYNHLSLSYKSKFQPVFSMKYISSKTLEQTLKCPDLLDKLNIENAIQSLFAVAEGLSYLHNHLICHGNLCPSNILIDDANQFYLCDFGLYPIKKLYIKEESMYNDDYKDPYMKNNQPSLINDVYSFGVLMCDICIAYLRASNKINASETLHSFLQNTSKSKFDIFPSFFAKIIPLCLNRFISERPSFKQIIEDFKNYNQKVFDINIQKTYNEFIKSNYLLNLASKEDPVALYKIGKLYEKGEIFEKNFSKALEYYERSAKLGNSDAQNNFGVLLQTKPGRNKNDINYGVYYLQLSAEQDNIHGMANYGIALLNGNGVPKNYQKAEEYLQKSADLGYSFAQVKYGCLLLDNNPSIAVISEGLKYIKKAMNQNNSEAYYIFGTMLKKGKFVEKNNDLALDYFKTAANLGNTKAIIEYADGILSKDPKNEKIALQYYQMAYDKGNANVKKKIEMLLGKSENPTSILHSLKNQENNKDSISKSERLVDQGESKNNIVSESSDSGDDFQIISNKPSTKNHNLNNNNNNNNDNKRTHILTRKQKEMLKKCKNIEEVLKNKSFMISNKLELVSLGKIVYDRSNYHSKNYIYPVGYQIVRNYASIYDPNECGKYKCSILDGGNTPIFQVECLGGQGKVFTGYTPSKPWMDVMSVIDKSTKRFKNHVFGVSGPTSFGLTNPIIACLIERLENADLCQNYVFQFPHTQVKTNQLQSSVNKSKNKSKEEDNNEDNNKDNNKDNNENNDEDNNEEMEEDEEEEEINNEEEENDENEDKDNFNFNIDLPTDELIKKGDKFYENDDISNAFKCYTEALKKGEKNVLIKCADSCQSFEEKLDFLERAIKENIPKSFSAWRMSIMRRVYLAKDNDSILDLAKRFEINNDISDAAIVYKKGKKILKSQICYERAKQNIDEIKDGYQQYDFALFIMNQKDFELAEIMLQKAIDNNIPQARSKITKLSKLKEPKEMNEAESLCNDGINYYEGKNGCQKDTNKAIQLFEKASQLGCPKADFYIGSSIKNKSCINHLKKSAESGDPDGQNLYANYLRNGKYVAKNHPKAMHFYKLAADQGQAEAMFEYGKEKYEISITEEEKNEGIEYIKKSAEKLFPDAIYMYSKIASITNPEDGKTFFEFAIEKGSQLAIKEQKSNQEKNI